MAKTHYQLIILGGGPAGLTAGLYAARARLDHLLIEKGATGGQVLNTHWIDNYPGFPEGISGFDLMEKMAAQAKRFEMNSIMNDAVKVELPEKAAKIIHLDDGSRLTCDSLIICTGAHANNAGVPGEDRFLGKGVSYCGTCDGPFFRNLDVAVIGGGNTAVQEAEYLTKFARKVILIHRRDSLRAAKVVQEKALANPNIEFIWNSRVTAICGDKEVEAVEVTATDGQVSRRPVQGVFVFIGITPNNAGLPLDRLRADVGGFIPVDTECRTCVPGVMAAGDICAKKVRQIVNACGEGAVAVLSAESYLATLEHTS
ncbi:MAG: thioredoxin-disulfide reductase [Desulfobulbaceae bacterium]|jgi:thioredoxin reductase (NADPH)|nr:thioredoxin-disulfide reductase [Desulfobulbaceae bacterium]